MYLQRRRRFGDTDRMIGVPVDSWGIAKSVKARDFDSRIRWFESNYPSQILPFFGGYCGADEGSLAQLVEQLIRNEQVVGSSPIISSI